MQAYIVAWQGHNRGCEENEGINASSAPILATRFQHLSSKCIGHVTHSLLTPPNDLKLLIAIFGLSAGPLLVLPKHPASKALYRSQRCKEIRKISEEAELQRQKLNRIWWGLYKVGFLTA